MNLEYFIASLPMLLPGQPAVLSVDDFRASCASSLDGALADAVEAIFDDRPSRHPFVRAWRDSENLLRNAIARKRASRLNVADVPQLATSGTDTSIEPAVASAFDEVNPLRRETALDKIRWRIIDEMQGVEPLSENVVLAYAVKLTIAHHLALLDNKKGLQNFDKLTEAGDVERTVVASKEDE